MTKDPALFRDPQTKFYFFVLLQSSKGPPFTNVLLSDFTNLAVINKLYQNAFESLNKPVSFHVIKSVLDKDPAEVEENSKTKRKESI